MRAFFACLVLLAFQVSFALATPLLAQDYATSPEDKTFFADLAKQAAVTVPDAPVQSMADLSQVFADLYAQSAALEEEALDIRTRLDIATLNDLKQLTPEAALVRQKAAEQYYSSLASAYGVFHRACQKAYASYLKSPLEPADHRDLAVTMGLLEIHMLPLDNDIATISTVAKALDDPATADARLAYEKSQNP